MKMRTVVPLAHPAAWRRKGETQDPEHPIALWTLERGKHYNDASSFGGWSWVV